MPRTTTTATPRRRTTQQPAPQEQQERSSFRLRIVEHLTVPADDILFAPLNPRRHPPEQTAAVRASLETLGWLDEVKVWRRPDGRLQLIDGEDRTRIARGQLVPVAVTDLTAAEAEDALATYDATTYLATYDSDRVRELAFRVEERDREAATLLRLVAEQDSARDLLARLREDAEDGAGKYHRFDDSGDPYGEDDDTISDEPHGDERRFDDDEEDEDGEDDQDASAAGQRQPRGSFGIYRADDVLDAALAHYRATGFPYRNLPVFVSMQRLNKLAATPQEQLLRTNVGGDVADTYHPHRFAATVVNGSGGRHNSPLESFGEDKLLRHALRLRLDDAGVLHDGYPTTLNVVNHTQAVSNFRPGFACHLYRAYCRPGDVVLDTSTGYGGRLVGWMASGIAANGGRYIGIDPNTLTHAGNSRMARELGFADAVELYNVPAEDLDPALLANRCDFAFTSPPYFAKERYSDEATQSWKRYGHDPSGAAWRDGFLAPTLRLQCAALKAGAYSLVNIADVTIGGVTYPLVEWTIAAATEAGFAHMETLHFDLSVAFGLGHDAAAPDREPVLVFRKPVDAPSEPVPSADVLLATRNATRESRSRSRSRSLPAQPMTLARWMSALYRLSADETAGLRGDLGVWPVELGDYLERLCYAYSPQPARYTLAADLLLPYDEKPSAARATAVLLYSGGKDSMAAGLLARQAGYQVHAVHVRRVNRSYPQEAARAQRSARALGWAYTSVVPERIVPTRGESVVKNQYCLALALECLDAVPQALVTGSYNYEDCHTTSWYSDTRAAYDAFAPALAAATGGRTRYLPLLADERQALAVWRGPEVPAAARALTCSCMMPPRNKPQHRRRVLARYPDVPLLDDDCGTCEKCLSRALILDDLAAADGATEHDANDDDAVATSAEMADPKRYPAAYLQHAVQRLTTAFGEPLWIHAHPLLESADYPAGASMGCVLTHVYGGRLGVQGGDNALTAHRVSREPAVPPEVTMMQYDVPTIPTTT